MFRLYEGEPPGHTSTSNPRRFSLEMWEGSLSWWGKSRRSEREVDYSAVLFKNLLSSRGLNAWLFLSMRVVGFTWRSFLKVCRQMGRGLEMRLLAGLERSEFFGVSDCLLAAKFKWPPWKHTPCARASTKEVRSSDSRTSFALARPANLLIRQSSLSWFVVSIFLLTKLPNLLTR